ncbi:MAG: hypothetical protein ACYTDY_17910, partial [Planctomycetota bacterium]
AVATEASRIVPVVVGDLAGLIRRFRRARVLQAYADDRVVAERLSAVGRRVRQPPFPGPGIVAFARPLVRERAGGLLDRRGWRGDSTT